MKVEKNWICLGLAAYLLSASPVIAAEPTACGSTGTFATASAAPANTADAAPATGANAAAGASAAAAGSTATAPAKPDNLESCLRELHESLRRMKGGAADMLHEVTRTQEVYNNGTPVGSSPWSNNPNYLINGGLVAQDALQHDVYLPPRPHWLNNSLAQMLDMEKKVQAEAANINTLLKSPKCKSDVRSQGFVLGDIGTELGQELGVLETVVRQDQPSNAKIEVNVRKIAETISGMERVGDRIWKEAPRGLKQD